ncbi:MAG TPA: CoA-binding protein [Ignavibacteriales bacterium]|nr:CoA-binding protein [Ignavibacteriales bacterium]
MESIESFLKLKNIAVIGVSSKGKGFGVDVYNHLKDNGYTVFGVNKNGGYCGSIKLYNTISMINQKVDGIITVVPPSETEIVTQEANELGIRNIWMQQGSESKNAIDYCNDNKINLVHNECILMFVEPVKSIHSFHRWINKLVGKYPGVKST